MENETIGQRIKRLLKDGRGWTMAEFCERAGISYETLRKWSTGESQPPRKRLDGLAMLLGVPVEQLLLGGSTGRAAVPRISWVQAGSWAEAVESRPPEDAEAWETPIASRPGPRAFALLVVGDSMTATNGSQPSFPEGTVLIVDPDRECRVGDFVIAKDAATQSATFKRLAWDGGRWYLRALNPAYPAIEVGSSGVRAIGRVIEYWTGGVL